MTSEPKPTEDWPSPWHVCHVLGKGLALRFRGACRSGVTVTCADCGQTLVYRKPRPGPAIHGQTAGPRDHF